MFWQFNQQPSAIDGLLSKDDCTLAELLNEDDVLQECKGNNARLIEFLVDPRIMEELVALVTTELDPDADIKTKYKHPNAACNLLTSDVQPITDKLISDESLLAKLWSFVETDGRLDALLASYFSKVIAVLLKQKPTEMFHFLQTRTNPVQILLRHVDTSAIMDLVVILTSCCESAILRAEIATWLNEQHLVESLVDLIHINVDEARQSNASQALCDIARMSRDNAYFQSTAAAASTPDESVAATQFVPDVLLQTLESPEMIAKLLANVLESTEEKDQPLINGINVLLVLIERQVLPDESQQQQQQRQPQPVSIGMTPNSPPAPEPQPVPEMERLAPLSPSVIEIIQIITSYLPRIQEKLHHADAISIESSGGQSITPLGSARLQIVRLVAALLNTGIHDVEIQLVDLNTMKILLDFFFDFELNNFLHNQVEQAVTSVVALGASSSPLFISLINNAGLLRRIVCGSQENDAAVQAGQRRRGYMGHLTKIAEYVARVVDSNPTIAAIVGQLPEEEYAQWDEFTRGTLAELRQKNEVNLFGKRPVLVSFDESGEEDDFTANTLPTYDSEQQQEYVHYQTQQMSNEFVEAFGFDEEDFPGADDAVAAKFDRILYFDFAVPADEDPAAAALFEACCQQRIKPYDESDEEDEDDGGDGGGAGVEGEEWEERELSYAEEEGERVAVELKEDEDEDEAGHVEFEWTNVSTGDVIGKPTDMDIEVPAWAQEPAGSEGDDSGGGWADFSKLSEADQPKASEAAPAVKYTTELAYELMNKESSDGGAVEVDSEDESDDSEERSGNYSFADDTGTQAKAEVDESPLPESEQGLPTNGEEVVVELGEKEEDLVENSVQDEELEENFVFLSSSGIMKGFAGGGDACEAAEAESSQEDVEKVRNEARKAMELYAEATNDTG